MNSKVHPLVAALVIVLTFVTIGVWVWGSGQAKQYGGPAELVIDPSGHLYVQIQNYLLEHDVDGVFVERHDLSKLGVERVIGATGFFSNGDILLRRGPDARAFSDNARAYMRLSNDETLQPEAPGAGMFRCDLRTASCAPFGTERIDLKAVFGLFIDTKNNDVYVTDTTRHLLRKFSEDGESLSEPIGGFRFPNQLLIHDERLYVVDTNHHQVRVVEPRTESFGVEVNTVDVVPIEARRNEQTWPSHFARVGDEWWVNNMKSGMDDGGVYVFDANWRYKYAVELPNGADPIAILKFNDEVLISDWNNDRIHLVSTDGQLLGEFESPGLQRVVDESISLRWQYQTYAYLAVIAFFLVIVALFVRGMAASLSGQSDQQPIREEASLVFPDEMVWIEPDAKVVRKIERMTLVAHICILGIVPLIAFLVVKLGKPHAFVELVVPTIGMIFFVLIAARGNRHSLNTAIGLRGEEITLRDSEGQEVTSTIEKTVYNDTAIAGKEAAIFLGRPQMPFYDREELESQVFPRLANARKVSAWEMQMTLIRMRHPHGILTVLSFVGVFVVGIWIVVKDLA